MSAIDDRGAAGRSAVAIIAAFAFARLAMMATLGLGRDEAYTLVISRRLALSYFDHPPLHLWIARLAALAFGETVFARLPFVALFALTGWLMFALTRRLYGGGAGLIALFALNATPFFFASAGGWIVPDGPLLAALAAAALALTRLFWGSSSRRDVWMLWLAVGLAFGMAGLSKYSAALTAFGLLAFLGGSRSHRFWLTRPEPYVAVLLALALVAPVLLWNAEHDWVSLRFQSARGAPVGGGLVPMLAVWFGQIAYLTPWIFAGLVAGSFWAARRGDERGRFLLGLAAPSILLFSLAPLWGPRGLPHWPMPGWFFLYPLLGAWLGGPARAQFPARRWVVGSAAFLAGLALLLVTQSDFGWVEVLAGADRKIPDPTLESFDWKGLASAPALAARPDFVVTTKWWEGGKVGIALGPTTPIFVFSDDPRGLAFLDSSARFIGRDAAIIVDRDHLEAEAANLRGYFERLDSPQFVSLGRGGRNEIELAIVGAHGLTRAFPVPYPLGRL